jgi:hypothetical protein
VTKVRTAETISTEKFFVLGKWLSSLSNSISSMLMISLSRECIISLFYRFSFGTFFFIPPGWLIVFLCFCRFVVVIGCRFDKLDGFFVSWLTTTLSLFITPNQFSALDSFIDSEWWLILLRL